LVLMVSVFEWYGKDGETGGVGVLERMEEGWKEEAKLTGGGGGSFFGRNRINVWQTSPNAWGVGKVGREGFGHGVMGPKGGEVEGREKKNG